MKNAFFRATRFAVGLLVLLSSIAIHAQPQYHVTELGPPPVGDWFHAVGINNDQQIIGCGYPNTYDPTTPGLPILFWSPATGFVDTSLRTYNSTCSSLVDINNRGQVLLKAANGRTYLWHPTDPSIDIGLPDIACAPGDMMCVPTDDCRYNNCATALNNHGHIVGFYYSAQPPFNRPFKWTRETGLVDLSILPNAYFRNWFHFQGITDSGDIVGLGERDALFPSTAQAFIWYPTSGLYPVLGASESAENSAYAISANGVVVGMSAHIGPFMWSLPNGVTPLPPQLALWGPVWDVNVHGHVVSGSTLWSASDGHTDLNSLIPHNAQTVPGASGKLNDNGDLVVNDTNRRRTFLLTRQRLELKVELVDPYPDFIRGGVVKDTGALATKGRIVRGVAADGVATIVLRLKTTQPGESVVVTVPGSTEENGFLGPLGGTPSSPSITVISDANSQAFVLYRAPLDFAWRAAHETLAERMIPLQATYNGTPQVVQVDVLRPLVALIHGLWGSIQDWNDFTPLVTDGRFTTLMFDYKTTNGERISDNAALFLGALEAALFNFALAHNVVALQADVIAHSMGGLITRSLPGVPGYSTYSPYKNGLVHKAVFLGSPQLGSPLARELVAPENRCVATTLTSLGNKVSADGAVGDLVGNGFGGGLSTALQKMQSYSRFPVANIAGRLTRAQVQGLSGSKRHLFDWYCGGNNYLIGLLTADNYSSLLGPAHDGIVPLQSALDKGDGFVIDDGTRDGAMHSKGTGILVGGDLPNLLQGSSGSGAKVIEYMNTPSTNRSVFR